MSSQLFLGVELFDGYCEDVFGRSSNKKFTAFIYSKASAGYVFYNATLFGGLINNSSEYVISNQNLNKSRLHNALGIQINFRQMRLDLGRIWQSSEFNTAQEHAWGFKKTSWFF